MLAFALTLLSAAAPAAEARTTAIVADRVVTVTGGVVENGVILIKNGKIVKIGPRLTPPQDAEIIEAKTLAAYPGMVLARTRIGLDYGDGSIVETLWPYTKEFERVRACGFTALGLFPQSADSGGSLGVVARPLARAKEAIVLGKSSFLCVGFNASYARSLPGMLRQEGQGLLAQAAQGQLPVIFAAGDATSTLHLMRILGEFRAMRKYVLPMGDVVNALPVLSQAKVPCMLPAAFSTRPGTQFVHNVPAKLALAGVPLCLVPVQDSVPALETFRLDVARLVAQGLPEEAALKAVTINAAAALGVDWRIGSLEEGKDADIVLMDGDLLDPRANVQKVFIAGESVYSKEAAR